MNTKHIKIGSFISVCAFLIIAGLLISQFSSWRKTDHLLPRLNKETLSGRQTLFPKEIDTSNAYILAEKGEYDKALALITGEDSISYYNRGVIKTMSAYQQASGDNISGLFLASTLITDAQRDFLLAQNLQTNKQLQKQIQNNLETITQLDIVVNAKTCYTISRDVISSISGINKNIDATKQLLDKERQALQQSKSLVPQTCFDQWENTLSTSQSNLQDLRQVLTDQEKIQQKSLIQKRRDVTLCIDRQDPSVIQNISDTQQMITTFQESHQQSTSIRSLQDPELITQLCQSKNDSQINQSMQSTIDKLLASLESNTQLSTGNMGPSTNTPQYTPLNVNEQKLLESIEKKNKIRIRQIQRLKSDPNYQGLDYINTLFNEFYGNTGDFIQ